MKSNIRIRKSDQSYYNSLKTFFRPGYGNPGYGNGGMYNQPYMSEENRQEMEEIREEPEEEREGPFNIFGIFG